MSSARWLRPPDAGSGGMCGGELAPSWAADSSATDATDSQPRMPSRQHWSRGWVWAYARAAASSSGPMRSLLLETKYHWVIAAFPSAEWGGAEARVAPLWRRARPPSSVEGHRGAIVVR